MDSNWFSLIITENIHINMPFAKVYIHFIWSTKDRQPFLDSKVIRKRTWEHVKENAKGKGIFIDTINGYQEHCHCLISLGIDQTMSKIMQLIKGESSHWINQQQLCKQKFEWQNEYFAVSVSESMIDRVREYITNQEEHHKVKTFQQEFDEFIQKCGFEKYKEGFAKTEGS